VEIKSLDQDLGKNQDFRVIKTLLGQCFRSVKIKGLDQDLGKNEDFRVIKTVDTLPRHGF